MNFELYERAQWMGGLVFFAAFMLTFWPSAGRLKVAAVLWCIGVLAMQAGTIPLVIHLIARCGKRFRTLNIFDEGVREAQAIEVDSSLPAGRVIRVLEQLKESRPLPVQIRVDNGPGLISAKLVAWCEANGVHLHHIQPGKPTQNAYIERFKRTFRNEVLNAHAFGSLSEVRDIVHHWMIAYNEERPHHSLNNLPPSTFRTNQTEPIIKQPTPIPSTFEMSH